MASKNNDDQTLKFERIPANGIDSEKIQLLNKFSSSLCLENSIKRLCTDFSDLEVDYLTCNDLLQDGGNLLPALEGCHSDPDSWFFPEGEMSSASLISLLTGANIFIHVYFFPINMSRRTDIEKSINNMFKNVDT